MESGKAVLGICRGAQLINVALGGALYQDIGMQVGREVLHVNEDFDQHAHAVAWNGASKFARLYPGISGGRVVSIHHQAIKTLGRGLRVEAISAGGEVIEAVRLVGKPYVLGVQWHPEFHPPGAADLLDCTPILDDFLDAASGRRWWRRRAGKQKPGAADIARAFKTLKSRLRPEFGGGRSREAAQEGASPPRWPRLKLWPWK
jgi:putative glutamine amidotransferase